MKCTLQKTLALFLAVLMVVLCAPLAFADDVVMGDCGDHVTYTWNKMTGAVTISGSGPMWDYDDWNNPSPFNESWNVRAIVIENGVTSVGDYAFGFCIYLQDVSFPYGLETIGKGAFLSTGLKNAALPRTVTRIGELAFHCADLVSVTLPKGLTAIQNSAFYYNEDLQTLNYTGSPADWDAITIGEDAFGNTPLSAPNCYYYGVDGAINAIDAIGTVEFTDECKARIDTARAAYDALSGSDQRKVTNFGELQSAEAEYARLEAAAGITAVRLVTNGAAANIAGAQQNNVYFGNYMQSSKDSKDPVKWRVLSNADGKLFLLADKNLDVVRYNEKDASVTWADCTLRKWLNNYENHPYNDTFIGNAFTAKEAAAVAETLVKNNGNDTTDKVFLLSIAEAANTAYGFTDDDARVSTNTGYVANGGHTGAGMWGVGEAGYWWLRSPGDYNGSAAIVSYDGNLYISGFYVYTVSVAVRPALNVDLGKVLFASPAVGGKSDEIIQDDDNKPTMSAVGNYTGSDWKLTVLDESRSNFTVSCLGFKDGLCTIKYSNAKGDMNDRISGMIADANGVVKYYGVLGYANPSTSRFSFHIPEDYAVGDRLYICNEEFNGDKKTDYSSALIDVTPTAPPTGLTASYGQTLSEIVIENPAGNTDGTWTWDDPSTPVGNVGDNTFAATFTPADASNFDTMHANLTVTVSPADPTYETPTDLTARCGSTLETVALPNGWTWDDPTASVGIVGADAETMGASFAATFTPEDTDNYNTVSVDLTVTVSHDLEDHEAKAETCGEIGWAAYQNCKCADCAYSTYQEIAATGNHTEAYPVSENEVPATCTENGSYDVVTYCSVCGKELHRVPKTEKAFGHSTELVGAKEATATKDGYTGDEVCTICHKTIKQGEVIPAKGTTETPTEPEIEPSDDKLLVIIRFVVEMVKFLLLQVIPFIISVTK